MNTTNDLQYFSGGTLTTVHALALHNLHYWASGRLWTPSFASPSEQEDCKTTVTVGASSVAKDFMKNGLAGRFVLV